MIKSRNQSSHTYQEEVANQIAANIAEEYYPLFLGLQEKMSKLL